MAIQGKAMKTSQLQKQDVRTRLTEVAVALDAGPVLGRGGSVRRARKPTDARLDRAIASAETYQVRYIFEYLKKRLLDSKLDSVSWMEGCGLEPRRGRELFKAEVHVNPADYKWDCRLEVSARLLITSELSVREISEDVGYSEKRAYIRGFKLWSGQEPEAFRHLMRRVPPPLTSTGYDLLSSEFHQRLDAGLLTPVEATELYDWLETFLLTLGHGNLPPHLFDRWLAEELYERRLEPVARPVDVEACRLFVAPRVLQEVMAEAS